MKLKALDWIGSSKKDLFEFPEEVKREMGYGLYIAQRGEKHSKAKPLKGFGGAQILEMIVLDESGTYRTIYTVAMAEVIFVLHAFQKKSKQGIKTPQLELELIKSRLRQAQEKYKEGRKK